MSRPIESGKSLAALNTFGFAERAERYAEAEDAAALADYVAIARAERWPLFVLGGGSNLVLTGTVPGLTLRPTGRRIDYAAEAGSGATLVTAEAGVGWHELVLDTLARGYAGLENLSLIPGSVGAAPVQNIGAYGVELAERFVRLEALEVASGRWRTFDRAACRFGYRDSLFKREHDAYVIARVTLRVGRDTPLVTHYASLAERLAALGLERPDARDVARLVCEIRTRRLPDPARIGNTGSFFENPIVEARHAETLRAEFPDIVAYPQADGRVKLAAGWMIERLGYRGHVAGNVGVHADQALVLVNRGGGDGRALLRLAAEIATATRRRFGVTLRIEPRIL